MMNDYEAYKVNRADLARRVDTATRVLHTRSPATLAALVRQGILAPHSLGEHWWRHRHRVVLGVAALRLIGRTRDAQWLPLIDQAWHATHAGNQNEATDQLGDEALAAWLAVKRPGLNLATAVPWFRKALCTANWTEIEPKAAAWWLSKYIDRVGWTAGIVALFADPSPCVRSAILDNVSFDRYPPPKVRDLAVGMLLDPDPHIREVERQRISLYPVQGTLWIPALLRFLNRTDLSPQARTIAEKAIRIRGYDVRLVSNQWVAERPRTQLDGGTAGTVPPQRISPGTTLPHAASP